MDLPPALARQIGPFPVAGWLAIGAAGIGLGVVLRRSDLFSGGSLDDPATAGEGEAGAAVGGHQYGRPGVGYGMMLVGPPAQPQAGDDVAPEEADTNSRWESRVIAWAINELGISGTAVDTAVRKYLQGVALNPSEVKILDAILKRWGPPPEGTLPTVVTDEGGKPGDAWYAGPGSRRHTTTAGETGGVIAKKYFGADSQRGWERIKAANRNVLPAGVTHTTGLPGGLTLRIP